jgi:uncharacterized delta-60 repeat protein
MLKYKTFVTVMWMGILFLPTVATVAGTIVDIDWVRRYNGEGTFWDEAYDLAVDEPGNVYVTGESYATATGNDYATVKYYPDGDTAWVRRYNGPGNDWDRANAIAVDQSGNVYVTGSSTGAGTGLDWATIKYNSDGDTLWVRRYNGPADDDDAACALVVDNMGNAFVTGYGHDSLTGQDYLTIQYGADGELLWTGGYDGPLHAEDAAQDLVVDDAGYIYVTGQSWGLTSLDYATIKYFPYGDTAWVRGYDFAGDEDRAVAVATDSSGNVFVTGSSLDSTGLADYATIRYNPNGDIDWTRRYDGEAGRNDLAVALVVDAAGNAYVTGTSAGAGGAQGFLTIKYYSNGDTAWTRRHHVGARDIAHSLTVDAFGNVYVTGDFEEWPPLPWDWNTVAYDSSGNVLWHTLYDEGYNEWARAIAVDGSGFVYVTGCIQSMVTGGDFITIKYVQKLIRGDANGDGVIDVADIVYLVNFLYRNGDPPTPVEAGDTTCDGIVDVADVVRLISYLYRGGNPPSC